MTDIRLRSVDRHKRHKTKSSGVRGRRNKRHKTEGVGEGGVDRHKMHTAEGV